MKYIKVFAGITLLAISSVVLLNCKKDDPTPLSQQQQAAKQISVTWGEAEILSSPVTGADGTLEDLTLTFSVTGNFQPGAFSASGAPEFFFTSTSSTWSWESAGSVTRILLSNVSPVQAFTIEDLNEVTLTISFPFDARVGGRIAGIGEYKVRMMRQ